MARVDRGRGTGRRSFDLCLEFGDPCLGGDPSLLFGATSGRRLTTQSFLVAASCCLPQEFLLRNDPGLHLSCRVQHDTRSSWCSSGTSVSEPRNRTTGPSARRSKPSTVLRTHLPRSGSIATYPRLAKEFPSMPMPSRPSPKSFSRGKNRRYSRTPIPAQSGAGVTWSSSRVHPEATASTKSEALPNSHLRMDFDRSAGTPRTT